MKTIKTKNIFLFLAIQILVNQILACQSSKLTVSTSGFEVRTISKDLYMKMLRKNVFNQNSPVPVHRLRLVKVKHFGFDSKVHNGEIIVLDACSQYVKNIFLELYLRRFPISKMKLITEYNGSDSLSMADNNTSGHNLRLVTGGARLSLHAYGTAIDLNPANNPFVDIPCNDSIGLARFQPLSSIRFANRKKVRLGKEERFGLAEEVVDVFARNGFTGWGGYWDCPIDYQHFYISRPITEILSLMKPKEAIAFYKRTVDFYNKNKVLIEEEFKKKSNDLSILVLYKKDTKQFMKIVNDLE